MDARSWPEVRDVLAEVITLPAENRALFLDQRCPDPEQRRQVATLLRHLEREPHFPDVLTTITRMVGEPAAPPEGIVLEPGTRVGPFVILERIGVGGMGEVFLGSDTRLHRKVALKCLFASSGDVRSRILHEAQVIAQINHPDIATVHDVVEHGPRTFLVMEYVEGESLASHLRRERLPIDRVIAIGRQLASALAAAHAKGVIHGDVKPANIQVKPGGSIKVLDFGVAQAVSLVTTGAPTTASVRGVNGGTPAYMSPEQMLGRRLDHRSDIYSLGVVLHEMVTGIRPYAKSDPLERLVAIVKDPPPRADAGNPTVPRALGDVIAKAMDADVDLRYQTAIEVEAALESVQRGTSRPPVAVDLRARLPRLAVGAILIVLAIGLLGALKTVTFNSNFGRTGPFARFGMEPWPAYFRWGLLGIAPKLFVMTVTTAVVMTVRFALRALALIPPVGRVADRIRIRCRSLGVALGLDKPATCAQVLAGLGLAMMIGIGWYHNDLINAFAASFNSAPIERLMPMRENTAARGLYQAELSIVTLVLAFGLYKVIQARSRAATTEGRIGVVTLGVVVLVAVLLNEAPYRSFNYRDFERVDLAGSRCYIIGESSNEFLLLCPGSDPPRNRTVKRDDPALRRPGIIENVFRGVNAPRPQP
jgi:serine/threonine protein kinase